MSTFHIALRRCETLWSAREIASMTLSAEQVRHTEIVFHIALRGKNLLFLYAHILCYLTLTDVLSNPTALE